MAEQESRTISSNIKWAYQRKFQNGDVTLNTKHMLGYIKVGKDEDGHDVYEINEAEAAVIRRIFRDYISGISIARICKGLEADGILTKHGKETWRYGNVYNILTNEKYTGNALLGKTWKPDVLSKKRQKNDGSQTPIYYVENTHPAIIDQEMFELVKEEMQRRREATEDTIGGGKYSSKYPFSGMLECGICGHKLRRHVRTVGSKKKVPSWGCSNRVTNTRQACDSHHVREDVLEATYIEAMKRVMETAPEVTETIRSSIDEVLTEDSRMRIAEIDDEIIAIKTEALELNKAKRRLEVGTTDYDVRIKELTDAMKAKEAERAELQDSAIKYAQAKAWLEAFDENVCTGRILTANDAEIIRMLVERIVVKDGGIEIHLKCGVSIQQEYAK